MTRLEELLIKFQDGSASPEELTELSGLLETPEARAALVDDFFMTQAIRGHLKASEVPSAPRSTSRRFSPRKTPVSAASTTWAWVAAGLLAAGFLIVVFSVPREEVPLKKIVKAPTPPPPPLQAVPAPNFDPPREPLLQPALPKVEPRPVEPVVPPPAPEPPKPPPAPREEPKPPAPPPALEPPKPAPEAPKPQPSKVVGIARIDKVDGTAFVLTKEGKSAATAGTEIGAGQGLETGAESRIVLAFPDKTQVELGADSTLSDLKIDAGPRLTLGAGTVRADVTPQPKTKPLIFVTPHAEAKVLGTILRLVVDRDPKKGTLLEVEKGRVELKRLSDRKTVIVSSGQFAVAALGSDLKLKPLSPNVPMVRFTFEDGKANPEWTGTLVAGPARPGNTGCLEGKYFTEEKLTRVMLSDSENGLFFHREGAVLTFDYYVDGETQILSVYCWDRTQSLSIGSFENRSLTRKQWTRATIPLGELHAGDSRLQEGDQIKNLTIQTNTGKGILFVDNVEISVPRSK